MSLLSLAPYDRLGHMEWTNINVRTYNFVVQSQLDFVPLFSADEFTFIALSAAAEVVIILTQCTIGKALL